MRFLSLFAAALLVLPAGAFAVETTIEYALPAEYCDGRAVEAGDIDQMEIYISAGPIPAADVPCASEPGEVDAPPESFSTRIEAAPSDTQAVVDLFPGQYYARARVRSGNDWSNLSNQVELEIPGPLRPPVILDMRF